MNHIIEEETGTTTRQAYHPHNGYYAGDFSGQPFTALDRHILEQIAKAA
jgi:hypothetical protein